MASELEMLRTYEPANYLIFSPTTYSVPGDILRSKNITNDTKCLINFFFLLLCIHPFPPPPPHTHAKKMPAANLLSFPFKNLENMPQNTKC